MMVSVFSEKVGISIRDFRSNGPTRLNAHEHLFPIYTFVYWKTCTSHVRNEVGEPRNSLQLYVNEYFTFMESVPTNRTCRIFGLQFSRAPSASFHIIALSPWHIQST